jgi:DNA processing protein
MSAAAQASTGAVPAPTVAVLPGPCEFPYPAGRKGLYRQILATGGCVVSELPPGSEVRRWGFPARNRIIAGLATMTVVVEAGARSGALVTAAHAASAGRPVGAVPGRVTTPQAVGSNGLLAAGATVIRDAQDVLDALFGAGAVQAVPEPRPPLSPEARTVLAAIARGRDSTAALARAGVPAERGLAVIASLELDGHVARGPGGRFRLLP